MDPVSVLSQRRVQCILIAHCAQQVGQHQKAALEALDRATLDLAEVLVDCTAMKKAQTAVQNVCVWPESALARHMREESCRGEGLKHLFIFFGFFFIVGTVALLVDGAPGLAIKQAALIGAICTAMSVALHKEGASMQRKYANAEAEYLAEAERLRLEHDRERSKWLRAVKDKHAELMRENTRMMAIIARGESSRSQF